MLRLNDLKSFIKTYVFETVKQMEIDRIPLTSPRRCAPQSSFWKEVGGLGTRSDDLD